MINSFRFSDIKVLIADSTQQSATTTKNLLHNSGMRDFTITRDVESTRKELAANDFDLMVVGETLNDEDVTPVLRDIRQGDLGKRPFLPIIALAWEPSIEVVRNMLAGGVDDLLTLPLSANKMDKALEHLVVQRKPFVVTANYIGPDRRKAPRPGAGQAVTTRVPNPLKHKATGKDDVEEQHDDVVQAMYDYRVESYISRIVYTIGKIAGLTSGKDEGTMSSWLEELHVIASDLTRRISGTSYAGQAALCHSLTEVTSGLVGEDSQLKAADIDLLQQIALALEIAVRQEDDATVHAALDIEKMIEAKRSA